MVRPWLQGSSSNSLLWLIPRLLSRGSRVDAWLQVTLAHLVLAESWVTSEPLVTGHMQKGGSLLGRFTSPHPTSLCDES